jgi:hypothetical protein
VRRALHPLIVLTVEALARRFRVEPADLWDWMDRKKPAPRWFVAAAVEAFYPGLRESDFDVDDTLTSANTDNTVDAMETTSNVLKSRARLNDASREHPAVRAWAERNMTVGEAAGVLAKRLKRKVPRSTLQAWYKPPTDPGYRRIPDDAARACEEEWGIPRSAWHRIIPA